jgi:hypothetical protein
MLVVSRLAVMAALIFIQVHAEPVKHSLTQGHSSNRPLAAACKCPTSNTKIAPVSRNRLARRVDPVCIAAIAGASVTACCSVYCFLDVDRVCDAADCLINRVNGEGPSPPSIATMEGRGSIPSTGNRQTLKQQRQAKFEEWKEKHKILLSKSIPPEKSFECGICLENAPKDEDCRTKLKACQQHQFCYTCISTWYDVRNTGKKRAPCPSCREEFGDDDILPEMFGIDSKCDSACGITHVGEN